MTHSHILSSVCLFFFSGGISCLFLFVIITIGVGSGDGVVLVVVVVTFQLIEFKFHKTGNGGKEPLHEIARVTILIYQLELEFTDDIFNGSLLDIAAGLHT